MNIGHAYLMENLNDTFINYEQVLESATFRLNYIIRFFLFVGGNKNKSRTKSVIDNLCV